MSFLIGLKQQYSNWTFSSLAFSPSQFHILELKWPNFLAVQNPPMLLHNPLGDNSHSWTWLSKLFIIISIVTVLFIYHNTSPFWSQDVLKSLFISRTYHIFTNSSHITWTVPTCPAPPPLAVQNTHSNPSGLPHPWTFSKSTTLLQVVSLLFGFSYPFHELKQSHLSHHSLTTYFCVFSHEDMLQRRENAMVWYFPWLSLNLWRVNSNVC